MIDSKQNQKLKPPAVPWRLHLLVGSVGLIVIGIVIYGFHIGEQLNTLDESLIDAVREMKLEAEAADLWFREVIRGNRKVDLKTIWQPLEQSIWRLHAILLDSKYHNKLYSPLKAIDTQMLFDSILQKLAALKKSTDLMALGDKTQGPVKQERLDYERAIR